MKTYKTICNVLLTMIIMLLLLGCSIRQDHRVSAPIITIKYISKSNKYIVMLDGRKAENIYENNFRITIRKAEFNLKPALTYLVDKYDKSLYNADYEFIFSDYAQAKEYLHAEPGKNAQVYAIAEATASGCFISTVKRDDISLYIALHFWVWIAVICIIAGAALYANWIRVSKSKG